MSYPSPLHVPEENSIDLRSSEISELYHQSILPLCNQVQRLTNQMEQWVSSPTKCVKMETGVSQSEQRGEPMHKEDSVDIFHQVVAHEMKLRTFSGTPDNSDQINVGEWIAEAKCNIRLLGYKGRGESAIYVDSGGTGRPPVGTGTKVEGEEVHQGGPLSSQEMESRPRECRKLLERREMANPCCGKPTSRGRKSGLVTQRVA
ncbi:hypothetical protein Hamer_G026584 [Homarus americanus]|nr:hypothetical protein Hamer_G026584 [Homarus americanus]